MKTKKISNSLATQVQAKLQQGLNYHQQGQLDIAQRLYREVLEIQPRQADSLHLLGVIAAQSNRHQDAIDLISKAIAIIPTNPHFYLNRGLALKEVHRIDEAIVNYDKAIALDPTLADVYASRAIALIELNRYEEAVDSGNRAVAINPNHAIAHFNLGMALKNLNRPEAAISCFDKAVALDPDHEEAYSNRGRILAQLNQHDAAIDSFNRAIELNPDRVLDIYNLGIQQANLLQYESAIATFNRAIAANPNYVEAYASRGDAQKELQQFEAAIASYDQAIAIKPDFSQVHSNRGAAFSALQLYDAAIASYDRAIAINPDFAEAYSNRGVVYKELKLLESAAASFERAYTIKPDYAAAYSNHGTIFTDLKLLHEAICDFDCAISIAPDYAHAYSNRGVVYQELNQLEQAISDYSRAIEIDSNYTDAYTNKSFSLLLNGDFEQGWKLYEWRLKSRESELRERYGEPSHWTGQESLKNKTILLHSEQGFGDTIQFCRYAKLCADLGARVILEVERPLISLFNTLEGVEQMIVKGAELPLFDYHSPLMSLPLAFKTTIATIPAASHYLSADPTKTTFWSEKLGNKTNQRVGLVWSGNIDYKNDRSRSIPLSMMMQHLPGEFQYVSLQREIRDSDKAAINSYGKNILHFGDELADFSDTAALSGLMDIIISVDTGTAHLAGALGKPVWLLLPFSPDFRWLLNRENSPWYPSIKLFRQTTPGNWTTVFEKIKEDLQTLD